MKKVYQYVEIGKVQIKNGFLFFSRPKDPTADMVMLIETFIKEQRKKYNQIVSSNFDLEEGEFTKFEFYWLPKNAQKIDGDEDCAFRMECYINTLYLKDRSFIFFETQYRFDVKPGCGNSGTIRAFGGKSYEQEEVYFNKITSIKTHHHEETYKIINDGCFANEAITTINQDGIIIRAGENFKIVAIDKFAQELQQARKMINEKVSEVN